MYNRYQWAEINRTSYMYNCYRAMITRGESPDFNGFIRLNLIEELKQYTGPRRGHDINDDSPIAAGIKTMMLNVAENRTNILDWLVDYHGFRLTRSELIYLKKYVSRFNNFQANTSGAMLWLLTHEELLKREEMSRKVRKMGRWIIPDLWTVVARQLA